MGLPLTHWPTFLLKLIRAQANLFASIVRSCRSATQQLQSEHHELQPPATQRALLTVHASAGFTCRHGTMHTTDEHRVPCLLVWSVRRV